MTRFLLMRQSLISVPNFFGSWIQSCTKLVGTHALLIIITFIIKMYVHKMTCRRLNARGSQVHFDDFSGGAIFCFTTRCASEIT